MCFQLLRQKLNNLNKNKMFSLKHLSAKICKIKINLYWAIRFLSTLCWAISSLCVKAFPAFSSFLTLFFWQNYYKSFFSHLLFKENYWKTLNTPVFALSFGREAAEWQMLSDWTELSCSFTSGFFRKQVNMQSRNNFLPDISWEF